LRKVVLTLTVAILSALSISAMVFSAERVTIHLWSALGGSKLPASEWLVREFEATHPHIDVEHTIIGNIDELDEKMILATAAGVPPDVVSNHFYFSTKYAHNGMILDLGPFMERSNITARMFLPSVIKGGQYDGKQYALPIYSDTRILYLNKEMFEESGLPPKAPETWEEFLSVSRQLVRFDEGKLSRAAFDVSRTDTRLFLPLLWCWGGTFFDEEGMAAFNSAAEVNAWQFWIDLYHKHELVPFDGGLHMKDGTAAMTFNNPAAIVTMKKEFHL